LQVITAKWMQNKPQIATRSTGRDNSITIWAKIIQISVSFFFCLTDLHSRGHSPNSLQRRTHGGFWSCIFLSVAQPTASKHWRQGYEREQISNYKIKRDEQCKVGNATNPIRHAASSARSKTKVGELRKTISQQKLTTALRNCSVAYLV